MISASNDEQWAAHSIAHKIQRRLHNSSLISRTAEHRNIVYIRGHGLENKGRRLHETRAGVPGRQMRSDAMWNRFIVVVFREASQL